MEAGIAAMRHKESVEFWHDGQNVMFRNLGVEKALGWTQQVSIGLPIIRIAQALVGGVKRAYFQDAGFRLWYWDEGGAATFIGTLTGPAHLEPYGNWLVVGQNGVRLWKGSGILTHIPGSLPAASILAKHSQHLLAFNSDSVMWPDVRNIEDWARGKDNTARRHYLRNLDSPIKAVKPIQNGLGIYTNDSLRILKYTGAGYWFGVPGESLSGIGAISQNSVVAAGFRHYGLTRNGIFITDGSQFQYIDVPHLHGFFEQFLDWTRASEVFGYHNETNQEVIWHFPSTDGVWRGIGVKYTNLAFSRYQLELRSAADREVFDYPLLGTETGLAFATGKAPAVAFVRTKPLDAGNSLLFKFWDYFRFVGKWNNAWVKLSISDEVNSTPTEVYDGPLETALHFGYSSVFLTIQLYTKDLDPASYFEVSQILASGEADGEIF